MGVWGGGGGIWWFLGVVGWLGQRACLSLSITLSAGALE
jgi:hypothetical protein